MTYKPERRIAFGPPLRQRLPSLLYFTGAILFSAIIIYAEQLSPPGSLLFRYVVEGDRERLIPSSVCAIILFTSSLAAVLREQMRGVVIHPDGIEMRELLNFGWPRVRRFAWSQIDKVIVPAAPQDSTPMKPIRLELWDGSRTGLPDVARTRDLGMMLERVALARAIPLEGGTGMLDDLGNPLTGD